MLLALCVGTSALAQTSTGTLRGHVIDPSGAVVPGTTVTAQPASGQPISVTSSADGSYELKGLAPGQYSITARATGFAGFTKHGVVVAAGRPQTLDIPLEIQVTQEKVQVQEEGGVDVSPANNASSVVLKGKDLDALSDDPDELSSELQALAGPSAGPNGGQLYIDGFTGGQLPPKSAIREIRINQNPFSAQYDRLGYGRIEILTKPGTDKYHGQFMFNENNSIFNSKNPFISSEPDYRTEIYDGNFGGPMGKKASFFLDAQRRNIGDVEVVNPQCKGFTVAECASTSLANPRTRTELSPRFDFQLTPSNTLTARYQYEHAGETNDGVGQVGSNQVNLPSLAYNYTDTEQNFQFGDTQVFGPKIVNETRFRHRRETEEWNPASTAPQISIAGFFASGGNPIGHQIQTVGANEIQNYTSISSGKHFIRFGARVRTSKASNDVRQNFNGTFSYASLAAFVNNQANQLTIVTGQPRISDTYVDAGLYAEDDWKLRPNLTVSYGMRYETQNDINDHADFAPRVGLAWGVGKKGSSPKTVLRAGYGIFYDRFPQSLALNAERLNGTTQQQFVIESPAFTPANIPTSFNQFSGSQAPSTTYRIDPNLRAPYTMQAAAGIEHQVGRIGTLSLTYLNSRGVHQLFTDNINAPLPGTFPAAPVCPLGCAVGNIYEYQTHGIFKQNQLIANVNVRYGARLSLFGFYTLNFANSDTSGAGSFPTNPYDPSADYGRAAFDTRNRLFIGGTFTAPFGLRFSPFVFTNSGSPYNITIPENLLGTSIFNARPGLATGSAGCATLSPTNPFCFFIPLKGQAYSPIPINFGTGPAQISVNLRVSKTFGLGPRLERASAGGGGGRGEGGGDRNRGFGGFGGGPGGGGRGGFFGGGDRTDRRYNLTFAVGARNIFNHPNLATPVGILSQQAFTGQSNFGQSISLANGPFNTQAANRRVDMQVMFAF